MYEVRLGAVAALVLLSSASGVQAKCMPLGPDDAGCLVASRRAAHCEGGFSRAEVEPLLGNIARCHARQVRALFNHQSFDEEGCEQKALAPLLSQAPPADCSCIDPFVVASLSAAVLDANNSALYCDPAGAPIDPTGDDAGNVPSTKAIERCEIRVASRAVKLLEAILRCHRIAVERFAAGSPFDEERCETAALTVFNQGVASLSGCRGCESVGSLPSFVEQELSEGLYCESPGGAFLDFARVR
ncbi:MAG TPA: hypothetical protein VKW76_14905 [Candidatus Binatia bacterium]|nr:hypothetical protein [Candidatus Binatia bacterium]